MQRMDEIGEAVLSLNTFLILLNYWMMNLKILLHLHDITMLINIPINL